MKLNKGDTIGIIALSGNCQRDNIEGAKQFFESSGYKVKLSSNIYDKNMYLAGSDKDKISELHKFFQDKNIKLVLCARGGYGAIRLINKIDYKLIKNNVKPILGYSDITALLLMIYKKTGIITYHSPMALTDYKDERFFEIPAQFDANKVYNSGSAKGILWGGNLSTIVSLCGLDFIPNKNFLFFTEDLNEPVYKIDKMFQQLFNINKFSKHLKGIILGDFLYTDNQKWLEKYFMEISNNLKIPVIYTKHITHGKNKLTIPIGAAAEIKNNKVIIKKSYHYLSK